MTCLSYFVFQLAYFLPPFAAQVLVNSQKTSNTTLLTNDSEIPNTAVQLGSASEQFSNEESTMNKNMAEESSRSTSAGDTEPRRGRSRSRPLLKRENATLGEDRYINSTWDQAIQDTESEELITRKPVKPSHEATTKQRPQEQPLTGLVDTWWAQRLRADSMTTSSPEEAEESNHLLPQQHSDSLAQILQRVEAWRNKYLSSLGLGSSPIERPHSPRGPSSIDMYDPITPSEAAHTDSMGDMDKIPQAGPLGDMDEDAWKFLEQSCLEEEYDPESFGVCRVRSSSAPYLDDKDDSGNLLPKPLQPTKEMRKDNSMAGSAGPLGLVETASGWEFVTLEPVSEPQKSRDLTNGKPYWQSDLAFRGSQPSLEPSATDEAEEEPSPILPWNPLSHDPLVQYDEMDVDLDQSNRDRPSSPTDSWERDSASDSSDYGDDDPADAISDDDESFNEMYSDPVSRLAPQDLPIRPASPEPEYEIDEMDEDIEEEKAIEELLKQQRLQYGDHSSSTEIPDQAPEPRSVEAEVTWAEAFLPASVLDSDPRYRNRDLILNSRLAQVTLINRALDPERRRSRYPKRTEIVIEKAVAVDVPEALLQKILAKLEEDHEVVDVVSVSQEQ